jgi:hypothetical protein
MNHMAHSDATRMAKGLEASLKGKLDDLESKVSKLETDLGRYVTLKRCKHFALTDALL